MNAPPEPLAGLVRDHRRYESAVTDTHACLAAAIAGPPSGEQAAAAFAQLEALLSLLDHDIERHIAKEERLLFPLLRDGFAQLTPTVDDMVAEHDLIKTQRARLRHALAELDDDHAGVREAASALRQGLQRAGMDGSGAALSSLRPVVEQLSWTLQGHFTGEEDGVFLPAEDLLSAAALADLARAMAAFDREPAE